MKKKHSLTDLKQRSKCFRCHKVGHWAVDCPLYQCRSCWSFSPGHYTKYCPQQSPPHYSREDVWWDSTLGWVNSYKQRVHWSEDNEYYEYDFSPEEEHNLFNHWSLGTSNVNKGVMLQLSIQYFTLFPTSPTCHRPRYFLSSNHIPMITQTVHTITNPKTMPRLLLLHLSFLSHTITHRILHLSLLSHDY